MTQLARRALTLQRASTLLLALILLCPLLHVDATAQNRRSDRHVIRVTPGTTSEGARGCFYEIQGQADQDLFAISPGGLVTVRALRGLRVDVAVDNDPGGIPGTRNRRATALGRSAPQDTLVARSAIGRSTDHRVRIQCCPDLRGRGRGQECPRWTDALPSTLGTGALRMAPLPPDRMATASWTGAARGPMARPALPPPAHPGDQPLGNQPPGNQPLGNQPPGGPVMRVEEL